MVRALDDPGEMAFGLSAEPAPPVTADVVEGSNAARRVADDQDALAEDVLGEVVARLRNLLLAADAQPGSEENPLPFKVEDIGRVVVFGGQGREDARGKLRRCIRS